MAFVLSNSVFLHCPKTAGHWISSVLIQSGISLIQLSWHTHAANIPKEHVRKFRFAFVRHPLTWYQSFFAHKVVNGWCSDEIDRYCRSSDFHRFIENVLVRFPQGYCSTVLYERYFEKTDFVGLFERIKPDLIRALDLAGEELDASSIETTPPENVSNYRLIDIDYTMDLRERVLENEKEIIQRFYQ